MEFLHRRPLSPEERTWASRSSAAASTLDERSPPRGGRAHPADDGCGWPLASCDRSISQQGWWYAISSVATHRYPPEALIAALARAFLREDAGFHAYQMLEAGVRQFGECTNEGSAYPHRSRPVPSSAFTRRAPRTAGRRHCAAAYARR
jgi:hypothetical protein